MIFWTITYTPLSGPPVTKDAATWGICNVKRKRKSAATDTVTFTMASAAADSIPPFAQWTTLTFFRNGVQWFVGVVTKQPAKASATSESLNYEISGPWYWLEQTVFQQQWVTLDASGGGATMMTTTRSSVIIGQSLDGIKMNSGQVMLEVLTYCQYAFQGIPYPNTVDSGTHLPAPISPTGGPYQIGALTPSIVIPYAQVRDRSCADLIRLLMKYSPSAVAWVDYTTTPPTLNIDLRANLQNKTISMLGGTVASEFNPTPRYDLQVPCVIAKFESHESVDGTDYDVVTVDQYPMTVPDNSPRAWIQTIDLVGGHTTSQKAPIVVKARPVAATDSIAMDWVLYRESWLNMQTAGGVPLYDLGNIGVAYLNTVLDKNDPLNATPAPPPVQNGFNLDCHTLVAELITGNIADWMYPNDGIVAAKVVIEVWLQYTGADPATAQFFWQDPNDPKNVFPPGQGYYIQFYGCKVTNAETKTYTEITSVSASEPVPTGFAEYLYNELAPLHYEGDLTLIEAECSDLLPPGSVFNTTDGNTGWQAMNALVLVVAEDIDKGTTQVQFGPPLTLGLATLAELFRANLGRLPAWRLQQRTTGQTTAGANVDDGKHSADTTKHGPPTPPSGTPNPYTCTNTSVGATPKITVTPGTHAGTQATGSPLTVGTGSGQVYVEVDFIYDASNNVTITDNLLETTTGAVPANVVIPTPGSGGSGTLYQPIATYTATVTSGKASVNCSPLVGGSQNFGVCSGAIAGPWGV